VIPEATLRQIAEHSVSAESRALAKQLLEAMSLPGYERLAKERDAARAENERLAKQRDELVKACTAKDDLLVCYRIGKQPSDTLFKRLDRAKKVLDAIAAEQPKPAGGGA